MDKDTFDSQQHHGLLETIKYNETIIIITVIFFIINFILSIIFIYIPIAEIKAAGENFEEVVSKSIKKSEDSFDRITKYIDKIEPQVDNIIAGVDAFFQDMCADPFTAAILKKTCEIKLSPSLISITNPSLSVSPIPSNFNFV